MKEYTTDKIRTLCLAGQRGCGKTSLADAIAFTTGVNNRIGRVDDGSSMFDYYDAELARKTTISSKLLATQWKDLKINLIDCPGHPDFVGELLSAARVVDAIGVVIDATSGVEIGTRLQWRAFPKEGWARFIFVNKLEKENVKWRQNLDSIRSAFGKSAVAVVLPIGEAESFKGLIDLLHMKAYTFEGDSQKEIEIPADLKSLAASERESLLEVAAESDDALLEKFFADGTLSDDDMRKGLGKGIAKGTLFPVFFGSASRNMGTRILLDFLAEFLVPANMMRKEKAFRTGTDQPVEIAYDPNGKAVAYIFKTVVEGHLGEMSVFRAISGTIKGGIELVNQSTGQSTRIAQIYTMQGKNRIELNGAEAGDLGILVKMKDAHTGNTFTEKDLSVALPPTVLPNPVMDVALKPKTKGEEDKIATGLHKLEEEDKSFKLVQDAALKQLVLWGQGSTHIEVLLDKLKHRFGVEVEAIKPRIPYRETVRGKTEKQYKHKKQSGGRGQYGDVYIRIEPNVRGGGFEFVNEITGGVIPIKYIPAVEKGVVEQMQAGGLAGAPVVDVRVALYFGSYHDVDSSDMAFKIAGLMAFKEGFLECRPVLLEPIFNIEIVVPADYTGDVMGDLSSRRGKISGMEEDSGSQRIRAQVPQAELYKYSVDLRSMTQGQGVYSMSFSHYEDVPSETAQKVIAEAKAMQEALAS